MHPLFLNCTILKILNTEIKDLKKNQDFLKSVFIILLPFPVRSFDCVVDSGLDLIFDNAWGHIKSETNKTK